MLIARLYIIIGWMKGYQNVKISATGLPECCSALEGNQIPYFHPKISQKLYFFEFRNSISYQNFWFFSAETIQGRKLFAKIW